MALDPRQLSAFLSIVETGSLGRAAEALKLTQPALSRIIKRLEAQLHVQLFERRTTGMELTTFGQALLPYATLLRQEAEVAIDEINALRGLARGTIRIGAVASAAIKVLPVVLDRLLGAWPTLHVHITEAVEDKLALALVAGEIDLALCGAIGESPDLMRVAEHGFRDHYSVIVAAAHPLLKRKGLTMHDLADKRWVMPAEGAEPRTQFNALIERLGAPQPVVTVETRSPAMIKAMVAQTEHLGWLPAPLFTTEEAAGLLSRLEVEGMALQRRFFVYRRRRSFVSPAVAKFLEELKKVAVSE